MLDGSKADEDSALQVIYTSWMNAEMLQAVQNHWLGSFLLNILGYLLILVPAALLIRRWKKSPLVQRGKEETENAAKTCTLARG